MAELIRFTPNRALDLNGDPAPGARAYFYAYGTTDLATVYADIDMTVEHPSPLVADGRGTFPLVYAAQPLAVTVTDADALPGLRNG